MDRRDDEVLPLGSMHSRLGTHVAEQRRARRLTPQQLAVAIGYRNVAKGGKRIIALERGGVTDRGDLLEQITDALALDAEHVRRLADEDREARTRAWEQWANESITPRIRFRVIPAVWCRA